MPQMRNFTLDKKPDMPLLRFKLANRFPDKILNFKVALCLLGIEMITGIAGYMLLENYNWVEAVYMVIITISTVGFMEVEPLSAAGRLFTSFIILLNIGIFAYFLAVFSYYILEGEFF
ncbi:MAG: two pore domain potassium channel family protein [Saprospiraceae bacterium]|nr:two pore domain potassium channel family protein [Saprospiraceae bacterium]